MYIDFKIAQGSGSGVQLEVCLRSRNNQLRYGSFVVIVVRNPLITMICPSIKVQQRAKLDLITVESMLDSLRGYRGKFSLTVYSRQVDDLEKGNTSAIPKKF